MNAAAVAKSSRTNLLEGIALIAILQAFPNFAGAALLLKLFGRNIVEPAWSTAIFIALTSLSYGWLLAFTAPKFPKLYASIYEPLFFDATLSFNEKAARWRMQPVTAQQQVLRVTLLSILAIAVVSVR